jgi:hypothetical protein
MLERPRAAADLEGFIQHRRDGRVEGWVRANNKGNLLFSPLSQPKIEIHCTIYN